MSARLLLAFLVMVLLTRQVDAQQIELSPRPSESVSIDIRLHNNSGFDYAEPELFVAALPGITITTAAPCSISFTPQWVRLSSTALQSGESVSCALTYTRDASPLLQTNLVDFGGMHESQGLVIEPANWIIGNLADLNLRVRAELPLPTRSSSEAFFRVSLENSSGVAVGNTVFGACSEGLPLFDIDGDFPGGCAAAPFFNSCNAFSGPRFVMPTAPAGGESSCQLRVRMYPGMSLDSSMRMYIDPSTPQSEAGYVISDSVYENNGFDLVLQLADSTPIPALGWLGALTLIAFIFVFSRHGMRSSLSGRARRIC